jgi:hypothetical protein
MMHTPADGFSKDETAAPYDRSTGRPNPARRPPAPLPVATTRSALLGMLSSRQGIRQALLLSELLGPPKGLRDSGSLSRDGIL